MRMGTEKLKFEENMATAKQNNEKTKFFSSSKYFLFSDI